jgi:hypothetical protein
VVNVRRLRHELLPLPNCILIYDNGLSRILSITSSHHCFFTHPLSPRRRSNIFQEPLLIGLCIDDTYISWSTQPLPLCCSPSLAAVLHASVTYGSFGGQGWPEVILELLWICGDDEVEVIIDEIRRRRRDSRILVDAWPGHDTHTRPGAVLEV